jgi:hypothetical protein
MQIMQDNFFLLNREIGMALDMLSLLAQKFNFTFVNISPKDRAWGAQGRDLPNSICVHSGISHGSKQN